MKFSSLLYPLSAIISSGFSYLLNLALISILDDKNEYSQYLFLNSWSMYFSSFSFFLIIDLFLSPNGKKYNINSLLNISLFLILLNIFILIILFYLFDVHQFLYIIIPIFGFSLFKLITQYFIYNKNKIKVIKLRFSRAFLISIIIFYFVFLNSSNISAYYHVNIQGLICILIFLFFYSFSSLSLKRLYAEIQIIFHNDIKRIFKRVLSLLIDTIHMPIFYSLLSTYSNQINERFIYLIGILFPASYVISIIIKEQILINKNFISIFKF